MSKIIIVSGPVILENNKVLLIKDSKDDFWKFCGGRVEDNDSNIKETAQREAKEEMGLELEILDNEPFFFYVEKEIDGVQASIILVHFLARRIDKVTPSQEIREWQWMGENDLSYKNLAPNIKPTLEHFDFYQR